MPEYTVKYKDKQRKIKKIQVLAECIHNVENNLPQNVKDIISIDRTNNMGSRSPVNKSDKKKKDSLADRIIAIL